MVDITVSFNINEIDREIQAFLEGVSEQDIRRRANNVQNEIKDLINSRSMTRGHGPVSLVDSIQIDVFQYDDNSWNASIFSELDHAIWFEEGTGIHGPFGVYIFPKGNKRLMYFKPTFGTEFVRAHRVQGQEPHNVFRDGIEAARR